MTFLKLNQGCIFVIIILAVSCTAHTRNETSVYWTIHGSVHLGNTTILHCRIDRKFNVCENDSHIRRWTRYQNQTILTFKESSSNETKYKGKANKHCTTYSLHIHNFGPSDFGVYTCSFGLHSKEFRLERSSFKSNQSKKNIIVHMLCSNNHLELEVEMQETFPIPKCYSNITNNSEKKNRIIHTHITGVQNATKDKIKFQLKDHSCSGVIHTFCLFDKTKVKVFNRTYNCCTGFCRKAISSYEHSSNPCEMLQLCGARKE
ncbi:uncharacterized protein LOC127713078 isoform X2 [Mytilus californianus]|uniref:uncharacterized protein LOC127713078 isoform X2 n=1 Tax=Mytilus californianus TaxID=6549 RepID=UPI002247F163|nr:uncharacterized protein LOC127713078 isoform X2 [Mytilus californianus]